MESKKLAEQERLEADGKRAANWKRWGPYLSERQWATVREDYSATGDAWEFLTHEQARSHAYRWGEDGLLGIADRECRLCFALALWNGKDPILKERLFGLTGPEGNHGEDVKECYFYLDATPTYSYFKALYKYPQKEFPYKQLVEENRRRNKSQPEFELLDTAVFEKNRYFDIVAEYAKNSPDDILIRITLTNRGDEKASLYLLPILWFRNTWSWNSTHEGSLLKPKIQKEEGRLVALHETLGKFSLAFAPHPQTNLQPAVLFTENETRGSHPDKTEKAAFSKDAFHAYLVEGNKGTVNPQNVGTKAALLYQFEIPSGQSQQISLRLYPEYATPTQPFGAGFPKIFNTRIAEANEFYASKISPQLNEEERNIIRQGYAGLLWSKQFYHYIVQDWLEGDPALKPPDQRKHGRNAEWGHLYSRDVISMPDKWEYPWFASWDLAFHLIPLAQVDPEFAKSQLLLFLREWYMHPNGQIPACEFAFSDVNPPVHAWAAWQIYKIAGRQEGPDRIFLERIFQKLLINFTWWVNRKDLEGRNLFSGGFLGLDNIGVFNRSEPLPTGGTLQQADGTAWMAFYCSTMLTIAIELAHLDKGAHPAYEDMASKLLEHFVQIADAMNSCGGMGLWDEADGFYYDQIKMDHSVQRLKIRSLVGLLPLITVEAIENSAIESLPGFYKRLRWFRKFRKDLPHHITHFEELRGHKLLSLVSRKRLALLLRYMLDENEFLSPHGIRSLSKYHQTHPFELQLGGTTHRIAYEPGESTSGLFGGNSNWRGPVWIQMNYLLIEALLKYYHFFGDEFKVEYPTNSGKMVNLLEAAQQLTKRVASLFLQDAKGQRAYQGGEPIWTDPHWRDLLLFYEYFHGETGKGLGASHQTGWSALALCFIEGLKTPWDQEHHPDKIKPK
jgi:hypothetical protein